MTISDMAPQAGIEMLREWVLNPLRYPSIALGIQQLMELTSFGTLRIMV
jgi:hypothetical protein